VSNEIHAWSYILKSLVSDFLTAMDEIEQTTSYNPLLSPAVNDDENSLAIVQPPALHPVREIRNALDKLLARIDGLESDFDRLAEKSREYCHM
jgi:hypothetical protein